MYFFMKSEKSCENVKYVIYKMLYCVVFCYFFCRLFMSYLNEIKFYVCDFVWLNWLVVFVVVFCVVCLIIVEFLLVSLLMLMVLDLGIFEGMVG